MIVWFRMQEGKNKEKNKIKRTSIGEKFFFKFSIAASAPAHPFFKALSYHRLDLKAEIEQPIPSSFILPLFVWSFQKKTKLKIRLTYPYSKTHIRFLILQRFQNVAELKIHLQPLLFLFNLFFKNDFNHHILMCFEKLNT